MKKKLAKKMIVGVAATAIAVCLWSFANVAIVKWRAEATANGMTYCLLIPADDLGTYKSVTSLKQLQGFEMQSPYVEGGTRSFQYGFHSLLVVPSKLGYKFYNWSYLSQNFNYLPLEKLNFAEFEVACKPEKNFAEKLKWK